MTTISEREIQIYNALESLLTDSKKQPFLFRTRFERTMIKLRCFARQNNNIDMEHQAIECLNKIRSIVDKSNTTSDGILRSFIVLEPDIKNILNNFQHNNATASV